MRHRPHNSILSFPALPQPLAMYKTEIYHSLEKQTNTRLIYDICNCIVMFVLV